jgi:catechol 2,3-dioxygenase
LTDPSSPSLPAGTSIGRVTLRVAALDQVVPFYSGLLGLRELRRAADTVWLGPAAGDRVLVVLQERPGIRTRPDRVLGLYHYAILLPDRLDLGRTLLRLFEESYPFSGFADHGVSEAAYLSDPAGNGIELAADRPRQSWPWQGGQIGMSTLALNVNDLLRRVDGDAWHGLPAGTTIGHIHLHVSDLARAERFYCDVLGFDVTSRNYAGALFMAAGGYHHHIGVNTWAAARSARDTDVAGMVDFAIRLPSSGDVQVVLDRVRAAGAPLEQTAEGWRTEDPDGNALVVM